VKIAITGHTGGLGQAIFKVAELGGHKVLGFSRTNGFDISNPSVRNEIVALVKDCDVFINNAFNWQDSSQLEMFFDIFSTWKEMPDKTIVNISSRAPEFFELPNVTLKYGVYKGALDLAALQAEKQAGRKCKILTLKPGKVDTPSIAHLEARKLNPIMVAEVLISSLAQRERLLPTVLTLAP